MQAKAVKPSEKADPVPVTRGGSPGEIGMIGCGVISYNANMCEARPNGLAETGKKGIKFGTLLVLDPWRCDHGECIRKGPDASRNEGN